MGRYPTLFLCMGAGREGGRVSGFQLFGLRPSNYSPKVVP
jgi:hypothetical protein